jgi:hypothetical protein
MPSAILLPPFTDISVIMDSLIPYLAADITLVLVIAAIWAGTSTFWHPLSIYLFFHVYSFTWRAIQLIMGAAPMYASSRDLDIICPEEFERAILLADVALVCFTIGAALAQSHFRWKAQFPRIRRTMELRIVYLVCAFCLPLGLCMLIMAKTGVEIADTLASSGYMMAITMWPIGCLIALIFIKGFRTILVIPTCAYLIIVGLQGYHRFMFILPMLCLSAIYLQQKGKRWPTYVMLIFGMSMVILFPSLKHIGRAISSGDYDDAASLTARAFYSASDRNSVSEKEFISEGFLDQYAGALTMIDNNGKTYWGSTYLAIVTLPIPRQLWRDKPGLADFMYDISTPGRPYSTEGRIITYIGESYLNFRYLGIFLIPLALGFGLSYWCLVATTGPWLRHNRFIYILAFMAFIQLFRDGLLSLILFTVVHNMPALFIWVAHVFAGRKLLVQDLPSDRP